MDDAGETLFRWELVRMAIACRECCCFIGIRLYAVDFCWHELMLSADAGILLLVALFR